MEAVPNQVGPYKAVTCLWATYNRCERVCVLPCVSGRPFAHSDTREMCWGKREATFNWFLILRHVVRR
jgi:hypothetical protein